MPNLFRGDLAVPRGENWMIFRILPTWRMKHGLAWLRMASGEKGTVQHKEIL